jgi:hypothetical protein
VYPADDLTRLARRKAVHRRRIAQHRSACVLAATRVVQPLAWLDRMVGHWRRLSPLVRLAAVPLAGLLIRSAAPRPRLLGTLLRWGPLALNLARGLTGARPN